MGVDGYHDGVNYMRAVCVIVIEKARGYFDDALSKLRLRMLYIMSRMSVRAKRGDSFSLPSHALTPCFALCFALCLALCLAL